MKVHSAQCLGGPEAHGEARDAHEAPGGGRGCDHGAVDPHARLDPDDAAPWLDPIAEAPTALDPDGALTHRANARAEIADAAEEVERALAPVRGQSSVVQHGARRSFEERFDLPAAGTVAHGDAAPPSPARPVAIRDAVAEGGIARVPSERGGDAGAVAVAIGGTGEPTATPDPLGVDPEPGPAPYAEVFRRVAATMAGRLSGEG